MNWKNVKEMVYGEFRQKANGDTIPIVLAYDIDPKGYGFCILNIRGSHPCAYVTFPGIDYLKEYDCDDIWFEDVEPHGGLTFFGKLNSDLNIPGLWLGWDYAHYDDYTCSGLDLFGNDGKKWTTIEILDECMDILEEIKKGKMHAEMDRYGLNND